MRLAFPTTLVPRFLVKTLRVPRAQTLRLVALVAIVMLAAALRLANLDALGQANHYYTAAVASMLKSWHNFFFVAAEPGGSVSVDKPPLGLWIQAISAYFGGVNGFSVLLPQILAGLASVVLIEHLVRRSFGAVAGLLAALVLAITPVVVATDRNNTMDSSLILTLLLAAWAFMRATESGRWRHLLLGAALVGMGFNIKMLQAYLPLPAFYALYFLGSKERLWRKTGKLAVASALLVAISLSWAIIVDLTPADQRPYVGSSGDNSEMSLMIGYNGVNRLVGMLGRRGGPSPVGGRDGRAPGLAPGQNGAFPQRGTDGVPGGPPVGGMPGLAPGQGGAFPQRGAAGNLDGAFGGPSRGFPQAGPGNNAAPFGGDGPRGGPGGAPGQMGQAGALRLFTSPLSKEVSWLLPFALASIVLLSLGVRLRWPLTPQHQAVVLWGGWLLTCVVFFSIAGFFHEYYLSMLAPPLAALVALGVAQVWRWRQQRPWQTTLLLLVIMGGTLGLQINTARAFVTSLAWLPWIGAALAIGLALLVAAAATRRPRGIAQAGFACLVAAMLVTPGIWSALTTLNSSANQSLPSAYGGRDSGPANRGGLQINQTLLAYLQDHTQANKYLMAVPSSMQGADYVLATGRPVLYLGGFMGVDQVVTTDKLAQMVCQGELRYIYWDARGSGDRSDISAWVSSTCTAVQGFDTTTRNAGAPDGTAPATNGARGGMAQGPGGMQQVSLYECGCHTAALGATSAN